MKDDARHTNTAGAVDDRRACVRLVAGRPGAPPDLGDLCALALRCPPFLHTAAGPLAMPPQLRLTDQVRYVHVDHPGGLAAALDLLTHEEVPASQWELTALEGYRADEHTLALRTTPNVYADEGLLPLLVFA